ncbi:MAG: phosphatase PAP2 family protein [Muribaculaceae bacterium]|nr:phosphatase PAP2 family protein [Muribaculaceae bacterium]
MIRLIFMIMALLAGCQARVFGSTPDQSQADTLTYAVASEKFRPRQLILPGALLAAGAAGVAWGDQFNRYIRDEMHRISGGRRIHADDYVQYVPAAAYLGLGAIPGVPCRHNFKERFMAEATAYVTMAVLTNALKYTVREQRPDASTRNSFPSGHTATVFTAAELIRQSYPAGIAAGAYTVAVGVAFLRLYNNRHWLNDVVAGAGIGILSARVGMWMLPLYRKWFHINPRTDRAVALLPFYNAPARSAGIAFTMTL